MDEAFLDLQKAMNPFAQNKDITELKITQHDANLSPVVLVGMSHQSITDMAELRKIAESYIRNELIRLEGVAEVTLSGEEVSTLTIQTDPYKLDAFQLKIEDIASRIESNNQSISGGRVSELGLQYLVKSSSLFASEDDFENLIVGYKAIQQEEASGNNASGTATANSNKAPVFLKEVATVQFLNARPENIVRINGKRSIGLSIYKEMRFNTVKVVPIGSDRECIARLSFSGDFQSGYFYKKCDRRSEEQCCSGCYSRYCSLVCIPSPDGDNTDCQSCYSHLDCGYFQSDVLQRTVTEYYDIGRTGARGGYARR